MAVGALDQATLTTAERTVLEAFVVSLRERLGDELHAVWLFGSRARGETVGELSDVDLLVIADGASWDGAGVVHDVLQEAAEAVSLPELVWTFSPHVHDPAWLEGRRAIKSFFIAEVERDRIDLTPLRR